VRSPDKAGSETRSIVTLIIASSFSAGERRTISSKVMLKKFDTRAIPAANPNNRLEHMKPIVQTGNLEGETISLREVIPFWFAVSSPLLGALLGLLGAWFVAWIST
jgi:hypothetical protein